MISHQQIEPKNRFLTIQNNIFTKDCTVYMLNKNINWIIFFIFSYLWLRGCPDTTCNICFTFYLANTSGKHVSVGSQSESIIIMCPLGFVQKILAVEAKWKNIFSGFCLWKRHKILCYMCVWAKMHICTKGGLILPKQAILSFFFTLPSLVHHICCRYYQAQSTKLSFFNIYRAESSQ